MKGRILAALLVLASAVSWAQTGEVTGTVIDAITKQPLYGAYVRVGTQQMTTDFDGRFTAEVPYGEVGIEVSFIGYTPYTRTLAVEKPAHSLRVRLETETMSEAEVVADVARERETPVAFTNVLPAQIQEELASQDLPMILNSTPGVYATQQGGGDGDARVTIRGFSQRNVAVMIDGVPVNDMENGWVYWSNWFGLDAVTQTIQVQRGLGASKIAIPAVGGTMNIISKGIDSRKGLMFKQEVGSFGFTRSTLGLTTGRLENGWGFTAAGSFKLGDGWVDQNFTEGFFYYGKLEKELGSHILSFSAFGAPQRHGQRSFKNRASVFSREYAQDIGYANEDLDAFPEYGLTYNEFWGEYQERFYYSEDGQVAGFIPGETVQLNTRQNFYHKPQFTLKDFWRVNDQLYISNIAYVSIGRGGGTQLDSQSATGSPLEDGTVNLQRVWDNNRLFEFGPGGLNLDAGGEYKASNFLVASMNNHQWLGYLGTATYKHNDNWTYSAGIDARRYTGEHFRRIENLMGGDYFLDVEGDQNRSTTDKLSEGDKILYYDEGHVAWFGSFAQAEFKNELWSAFVNVSGALSRYKGVDYFRKKVIDIDGETYEIGYLDEIEVGGQTYDRNSPGLQTYETEWVNLTGFTVKGGANYNVNEWMNTFVNLGWLNRAPRFNSVITTQNNISDDYANELVRAIEYGLSFANDRIASNLNAYYTNWNNRPVNRFVPITTIGPGDVENAGVFVTDMDALHMGVELDFSYEIHPDWTLEGVVSVGDWTWQSEESEPLIDNDSGQELNNPDTGENYIVSFDPRGVHVGDAAQTQLGSSLRYTPTKQSYIKARYTYFDRNWSDFNPESSVGDNAGRDPWRIPAYGILDVHAGYTFKFEGFRLQARASIFNALDAVFVSDAQNNDTFLPDPRTDWDAASASVFFGAPRRFNFSLTLNL